MLVNTCGTGTVTLYIIMNYTYIYLITAIPERGFYMYVTVEFVILQSRNFCTVQINEMSLDLYQFSKYHCIDEILKEIKMSSQNNKNCQRPPIIMVIMYCMDVKNNS